jgi:DHA1 family bicyclomycin/chloramphenicol resistance-like MFS transporter
VKPENGGVARAPLLLVFLLAGLTSIGPFSIDTYLPSFHAIAGELATNAATVQQTQTAYLLPFTLMTLWHGALADALGRRRVILFFLGCFVAASIAAACAANIEQLLLARALQGATAGAGIVIGRAVVRDVFVGPSAQRLMAHVTMLFALAPAVAPIIGGWLQTMFGWRSVFVFLAAFGALVWLLTAWRLQETLPLEKRQPLHPVYLWRSYRGILLDRDFLALTLSIGCSFAGFFLYVLSAPVFLMRHLGVSETGFAWLFVPSVAGMIVGSWISGRKAGHWSARQTVLRGFTLMGAAAATNLVVNLMFPPGLPWSVAPLFFYTLGNALAMPNLTLMGLDRYPEQRGLAASCQSFLQAGITTLSAGLLAPLIWETPLRLALGQCTLLAIGFACARRQLTDAKPIRGHDAWP